MQVQPVDCSMSNIVTDQPLMKAALNSGSIGALHDNTRTELLNDGRASPDLQGSRGIQNVLIVTERELRKQQTVVF